MQRVEHYRNRSQAEVAPLDTLLPMNRLIQAVLAALALPGLTSAQVFYAVAGSGSDQNWRLDLLSSSSIGPQWSGAAVVGLADDDSAQVYYTSAGLSLFGVPYGVGSVGLTLGRTTYLGANRPFTGLATDSGVLYGSHNFGVEGLYTIDLVTLDSTMIYAYSDSRIALEGLDFDPATGLLYGANDGEAYVDPAGGFGRGVVVIDLFQPTPTEVLINGYPSGATDIDGLAFDPAGNVYLIEDEPAPLHNFDVATGTYDPTPVFSVVSTVGIFSGGTYTTGIPLSIGTNYCVAAVNSSGAAASMSAQGSVRVADNSLTITASNMPSNAFGVFLTSSSQGFVQMPGGSQGNLCLAGRIGRFVGPGQIQNSGAAGSISLVLDLTRHPNPTGFVGVQPRERWNFTAWYRDTAMGVSTSNFADGLEIRFN